MNDERRMQWVAAIISLENAARADGQLGIARALGALAYAAIPDPDSGDDRTLLAFGKLCDRFVVKRNPGLAQRYGWPLPNQEDGK